MKKDVVFCLLIIILAFGYIGCDLEETECDPENGICRWTYIEPVIDYSLPQFYIEGLWAKDDASEELSINTYAHFWAYQSGTCPTCSPAIDPPMPEVIFYPLGKDAVGNSFFLSTYDGTAITFLVWEVEGEDPIEVSYSAIVSENKLTVDGLEGIFENWYGGGFIELNNFNGIYTLITRP